MLGQSHPVSAQQSSFNLPGDGKWYKVAVTAGQHAWFEYSYSHGTGHNPSIATGEIQFINSQNHMVQYHQTMGYSGWNQPQFALVNTGATGELWVRATNGAESGNFTMLRSRNTILAAPEPGVTALGGGTVTIYDKLSDNAHHFNGNVSVRNGGLGIGAEVGSSPSMLNLRHTGLANGESTTLANFVFQGENHFSGFTEGKLTFSSQAFQNGWLKKAEIGYSTSGNYGMGGALRFYTSPADESFVPRLRMIVDHDGRVGIGTDRLEDYRLSVNGKIRASEVKVYTGWADFVFEPGYQLRPLDEVEEHIKVYGHLPDVPSAAEIEEHGVDLGRTDALLLQKIEELTLYLLEQDKRLKKLETENIELKAKININNN